MKYLVCISILCRSELKKRDVVSFLERIGKIKNYVRKIFIKKDGSCLGAMNVEYNKGVKKIGGLGIENIKLLL